jgi:hypothetical protein
VHIRISHIGGITGMRTGGGPTNRTTERKVIRIRDLEVYHNPEKPD